jgi:uncharacterized SAM-binding protein YcdF (DUF218 family)
MFFYLSKILSFLTHPSSWLFILLIWAVFTKVQVRKQKLIVLVLCLFFVFGNSALVGYLNRVWEVPPVADQQVKKTKIAIVLGGISYYDTHLKRIHFQRSSDRIFHALRLYKAGVVDKIFISGGAAYISKSYETESVFLKEYLLQIGVPDSVIIIESKSRNTYENAIYTKQELEALHLFSRDESYLLFTSGYHMRRAVACYQKQGFRVNAYSVDGSAGDHNFQLDELLIPSISSFQNWDILIHEWVGYFTYFITGKI